MDGTTIQVRLSSNAGEEKGMPAEVVQCVGKLICNLYPLPMKKIDHPHARNRTARPNSCKKRTNQIGLTNLVSCSPSPEQRDEGRRDGVVIESEGLLCGL